MTERQLDPDWERVQQKLDHLATLITTTLSDLTEENAQLRAEIAKLRAENAALRQQLDRSQE